MQCEADNAPLSQRFAALIAGIPQFVWTSFDDGHWTWASPRWTSYTGLTVEMSKGLGWVRAVHPDDRAAVEAAWQQATLSGVLDVEHRLLSADPSREARWFRTFAKPSPNEQDPGLQTPGLQNNEREWLGTCTDIHETRLLEERQRSQLDVLQRRVCNVLALTRSVARRTAKASGSVEDFALHLDTRLDAIARTQTMLLHGMNAGVSVEMLVADGLLSYAAHEGEQVKISGPPLQLQGKVAELLGLMMHELAMNAVEHGALATPQGRVAVTWRVASAAMGTALDFEWLETGVALPDGKAHRPGFGTELIERTLEQELGATASLVMGAEGARCTVHLPLTNPRPSAARMADPSLSRPS